jgi:hypothetical protein
MAAAAAISDGWSGGSVMAAAAAISDGWRSEMAGDQ